MPNGLLQREGTEHAFDLLILATGFDAGTGARTRIEHSWPRRPVIEGGLGPPYSHHDGTASARLPEPLHVWEGEWRLPRR